MDNNQLTDNQLTKIIESAEAVISALAGTNEDVHPDNSTEMCRLYDWLNDNDAPPEVVLAMAREIQERREAMKPLAGIDLESAVDRLAENCNSIQGVWCSDKRSAYYSGFRDGAAIGLNAEKNGSDDE